MTERAAVFGQPISHSKSPLLHRAAYAALGIEMDYEAVEAGADQAPELAQRMRTEPGWRGASVTMPLKQPLVSQMDSVSERVARLGALNTVVVRRDGEAAHLHGHNTDVDGIVRALRHHGPLEVRNIAILGAGGTAAAATEAAAELGAASIDYAVRTAARAEDCARLGSGFGAATRVVDFRGVGARIAGYDAVVCTLPPRAADGLLEDLRLDSLRSGTVLLDVAYDPWPSRLAQAWEENGGTVVSGLTMLVHQAVEQVALFTGTQDPAALARVTNVMCDAVGLPRPVG